jgi:hypothetical protein
MIPVLTFREVGLIGMLEGTLVIEEAEDLWTSEYVFTTALDTPEKDVELPG